MSSMRGITQIALLKETLNLSREEEEEQNENINDVSPTAIRSVVSPG